MLRYNSKQFKTIFQQNKVVLAYLFGSEARGQSHEDSDIDIGVLFDKKVKADEYLRLEGKLIEFFSGCYPQKEINLVNLNIASPLLKQACLLEGKLLYQKSGLIRILFQFQTLHEYEEYLHLSNIYDKFLEQKLKTL